MPPPSAKNQNTSGQATILAKGGGGNGGNGGGNSGGNSGGNGNGNNNNGNSNGNGSNKDNNSKGSAVENDNKEKSTYYLNDVADPLTQVLMTYDEKDNYKAAYAYGLERFEVQALDNTRPESQDPLYYLYDGLGSVAQLTRPNGEVRDHYRYDEFGVPAPGAKLSEDGRNVNHNSFGYTGESWDEEDDLLYLRSRYYQADAGRFLTRDNYDGVLHTPLSRHLYVYVENNSIS